MGIELHQFPKALGVPNLSQFCMKTEIWLRLAGLPYEVRAEADPRKGPVGKLPFIRDDGAVIHDSERIIAHLARKHGVDLDAGLGAEQRAVARAFERMLNEHSSWGVVYARWLEDDTWPTIRKLFFGRMPQPLRTLVPRIARRQVRAALWAQGLARHPREVLYGRIAEDVQALADHLGGKPFFMGELPTTVDATVYAFLANCWQVQLETPLKPLVGKHPNLVAYCERMRQRCFG